MFTILYCCRNGSVVLRIRRRCRVFCVKHTHGMVIPHQLVSTFFGRLKNAVLNIEQHLQEKQQQQQQQQQHQQQQPTTDNVTDMHTDPLNSTHEQQQPTTDNVTDMHTDPLNSARIRRQSTRRRYPHVRLPYSNLRRSTRHKPQPI